MGISGSPEQSVPGPSLDIHRTRELPLLETQVRFLLFPKARAPARAFVFSGEPGVTCFAGLDECGRIGPCVSRQDPRHNDSPVFGLAGFVLPSEKVRGFGTWIFQRTCQLFGFEINRSGQHPALWENKGARLYTVTSVTRCAERRWIEPDVRPGPGFTYFGV